MTDQQGSVSVQRNPMKRRDLIQTMAMTVLGGTVLLGSGTAASAKESMPSLDGMLKHLRVGQTVEFDRDLRVTFIKVVKDSRCPVGVQCVWEGDAEVLLQVQVGMMEPELVRLHTTLEPRFVSVNALPGGIVGIPKTYGIVLRRLTPRPVVGRVTRQHDFVLTLKFSVAV
jgi:hypothetical protein